MPNSSVIHLRLQLFRIGRLESIEGGIWFWLRDKLLWSQTLHSIKHNWRFYFLDTARLVRKKKCTSWSEKKFHDVRARIPNNNGSFAMLLCTSPCICLFISFWEASSIVVLTPSLTVNFFKCISIRLVSTVEDFINTVMPNREKVV